MDDMVIKEMFNLILSAEVAEPSLRSFYEKLQPSIQPVAEKLHIARIDLRVVVEPNVYEINGRTDTFTNFYYPEADSLDKAMVLDYPAMSHTKGTATFFPWKGHVWSAEEREQISIVSRLVNISLSRCNMMRYQEDAPFIDLMTGLTNNAGVMRAGKRLEATANMSEYAGCFMNLKNFKFINQHLTQAGADAALRKFAHRLYNFLDPRRELVARLGGDNFFALVRKSHLEEFLGLAMGMNMDVEHHGREDNVSIGARVGIYLAKEKDSVPTILNDAAFAFERAKRSRQAVSYYDETLMNDIMRSKQTAAMIPEGIAKNEFVPFYQPKVRASSNSLYGCEALCRWIRDGKMVPPSEFIEVAETSGLITQLDQYMLRRVCKDIRSWLDAGIEPVPVSINFSQQDFNDDGLIDKTLDTLHEFNVDGKYLEIEITESSFHENYRVLEDFVKVMHENGIRVSLDDFGTGYSSLTMFKNLDLDTIKLDKSFFDDLEDQGDADRVILESVSSMINRLNKVSVSEGVETDKQLSFAKEIGCDIIQGFFFDRPLGYDDFTQRLRVRRYAPDGKWGGVLT